MRPVCEVRCAAPLGFWSALDVWINKPHVVNKRLCGAKVEQGEELSACLSRLWGTKCAQDLLVCVFNSHNEGEKSPCEIRTIIPKVCVPGGPVHKEVIVRDLHRTRVTFLPFQESPEGRAGPLRSNVYQIQLSPGTGDHWCLSLSALQPDAWLSDGVSHPRLSWLGSELLPRLSRWATESHSSEFRSTLSLIPLEKYGRLYQSLKDKYRQMVKVWPEVTDPEKFVYEDVAIATYLLVLWEEERRQTGQNHRQNFVDLGCGNGLLVHILTNEGHPGRGIDVRKRKIWDMYGPHTQLEESTITPSEDFLFPRVDWLIGNHSDELTPWIPLLSARSSFSSRFFLLPCCFFDFSGKKYQRRRSGVSQYREYLDYVTDIGRVCGFHVEEDCLRIPSTKRVCVIGRSRTYEPADEPAVERSRALMLRDRMSGSGPEATPTEATPTGPEWGVGFQPRPRIEVVRNCAGLPRQFIETVVLHVGMALLELQDTHGEWNTGGCLSLSSVAELLDKDALQRLKNECGGLQTLLRNNQHVFKVERGHVTLRDWRQPSGGRKLKPGGRRMSPTEARKTRLCWFHAHHPQGCPLPNDRCNFAHGTADLLDPPKHGKSESATCDHRTQ